MSYAQIISDITDAVISGIDDIIKHAKVDQSYKMLVTKKENESKYLVLHKDVSYTASGYRTNIQIGDYVMVCVPCGDWSDLYII